MGHWKISEVKGILSIIQMLTMVKVTFFIAHYSMSCLAALLLC